MKEKLVKLVLKILPYGLKFKIAQKMIDNRLIVTKEYNKNELYINRFQ